MPDLTYVVYDNETFFADERIPLLKKDTPPRFLALSDITTPTLKNADDIITLKNATAGLDSEVQALQAKDAVYKTQIEDNTARINNLEDEDLRSKFLIALELATIRKNFANTQEIEIEYGRKEIISIKVYVVKTVTDERIIYQESSSAVLIENVVELDSSNLPTIKKIIIKSNIPITGYCVIL